MTLLEILVLIMTYYSSIFTDFSLKDHHVVTPVVVGQPKMKLRVNVVMPPVVMKIVKIKMILLIILILLRFRLNKVINRELKDEHNIT